MSKQLDEIKKDLIINQNEDVVLKDVKKNLALKEGNESKNGGLTKEELNEFDEKLEKGLNNPNTSLSKLKEIFDNNLDKAPEQQKILLKMILLKNLLNPSNVFKGLLNDNPNCPKNSDGKYELKDGDGVITVDGKDNKKAFKVLDNVLSKIFRKNKKDEKITVSSEETQKAIEFAEKTKMEQVNELLFEKTGKKQDDEFLESVNIKSSIFDALFSRNKGDINKKSEESVLKILNGTESGSAIDELYQMLSEYGKDYIGSFSDQINDYMSNFLLSKDSDYFGKTIEERNEPEYKSRQNFFLLMYFLYASIQEGITNEDYLKNLENLKIENFEKVFSTENTISVFLKLKFYQKEALDGTLSKTVENASAMSSQERTKFISDKTGKIRFDSDIGKDTETIKNIQQWAYYIFSDKEITTDGDYDERTQMYVKLFECDQKLGDKYNLVALLQEKSYEEKQYIVETFHSTYRELLIAGKYFVNLKIEDVYRRAFMDVILFGGDVEQAKKELRDMNQKNIEVNLEELLAKEIISINKEVEDIEPKIQAIENLLEDLEEKEKKEIYECTREGKFYQGQDAINLYHTQRNELINLKIEKYQKLLDVAQKTGNEFYRQQIIIEMTNHLEQETIISKFGQDVWDEVGSIREGLSQGNKKYDKINDIVNQFESEDDIIISNDVTFDEYKNSFYGDYQENLNKMQYNYDFKTPAYIKRITIPGGNSIIVNLSFNIEFLKLNPGEKIVITGLEQKIGKGITLTSDNIRIASKDENGNLQLKMVDGNEDMTISNNEIDEGKKIAQLGYQSINTPEFQHATNKIIEIQEQYTPIKDIFNLFESEEGINQDQVDDARKKALDFKDKLYLFEASVDNRKVIRSQLQSLLPGMEDNNIYTGYEKQIRDYIDYFDAMIQQFEKRDGQASMMDEFLSMILDANKFNDNDKRYKELRNRLKNNTIVILSAIAFAVGTTVVTVFTFGAGTPLLVVSAAGTLGGMIGSRVGMLGNELLWNTILPTYITTSDGKTVKLDYNQPTDVELYINGKISGGQFWGGVASEFVMGTISTYGYLKAGSIIGNNIMKFVNKNPQSRLTNFLKKTTKGSFFDDLKQMGGQDMLLNSTKSKGLSNFFKEFKEELGEEAVQMGFEQGGQAISDSANLPFDIGGILGTGAAIWSCLNSGKYQKDFFTKHKMTGGETDYIQDLGILKTEMKFDSDNEQEIKNYFEVRGFKCEVLADGTLKFNNPEPVIDAKGDKKAITQEFVLTPSKENVKMRSNNYFKENYQLEYDEENKIYKYPKGTDIENFKSDLKKVFIVKETYGDIIAVDPKTGDIVVFMQGKHELQIPKTDTNQNNPKENVVVSEENIDMSDETPNSNNLNNKPMDGEAEQDVETINIDNDVEISENSKQIVENTVEISENKIKINQFTDAQKLQEVKSDLESKYPILGQETRSLEIDGKTETKSIVEWMLIQGGYEIVLKDGEIHHFRNTASKKPNEVMRLTDVLSIGDANGGFRDLVKGFQDNSCIGSDVAITKEGTIEGKDSKTWIGGNKIVVLAGDVLGDRKGKESVELIKRLMELKKQAKAEGGDIIINFGNHEELLLGLLLNTGSFKNSSNIRADFHFEGTNFFIEKYLGISLNSKSVNDIKIDNKTLLEEMRNDPDGKIILEALCQMPLIEQIDDGLFIHCLPAEKIADVFMQGQVPGKNLQEKIDYINSQFSNYLRNILLGENVSYDENIANEIFYNIVGINKSIEETDENGKTIVKSTGWNNTLLSTNSDFYDYLYDNGINSISHGHIAYANGNKTVITQSGIEISVIGVDGKTTSGHVLYTEVDKDGGELIGSGAKNVKTIDLSKKPENAPSQEIEENPSQEPKDIEAQPRTNNIEITETEAKNDFSKAEIKDMRNKIKKAKQQGTESKLNEDTKNYKQTCQGNSNLMDSDILEAIKKLESELIARGIVQPGFTFSQEDIEILQQVHQTGKGLFESDVHFAKIRLFNSLCDKSNSERAKNKDTRNAIREYAMNYGYMAKTLTNEQKEKIFSDKSLNEFSKFERYLTQTGSLDDFNTRSQNSRTYMTKEDRFMYCKLFYSEYDRNNPFQAEINKFMTKYEKELTNETFKPHLKSGYNFFKQYKEWQDQMNKKAKTTNTNTNKNINAKTKKQNDEEMRGLLERKMLLEEKLAKINYKIENIEDYSDGQYIKEELIQQRGDIVEKIEYINTEIENINIEIETDADTNTNTNINAKTNKQHDEEMRGLLERKMLLEEKLAKINYKIENIEDIEDYSDEQYTKEELIQQRDDIIEQIEYINTEIEN